MWRGFQVTLLLLWGGFCKSEFGSNVALPIFGDGANVDAVLLFPD